MFNVVYYQHMARKSFRNNKFWWVNSREKIVFLILLGLIFLITPHKQNQGIIVTIPEFPLIAKEPLAIPTPAPYPLNTTGILPGDEISAYGVYVVDVSSGATLYQKNAEELLAPASTTKLMTAMVSLDEYKPDDIVVVKEATLSGQIMDLVPGERMTVENLLYGLLIESANDAAYVLAQHHPQGPQGFMNVMNKKAQELSLNKTHFVNPAGFDDVDHNMTAKDLANMARFAIQYPLIAKIVSVPQITVPDVDYKIFHQLRTTNMLLGKIPGVSGIKTGFTPQAGENLVTMVQRDGRKVIIVALRSKDRFSDTELLIQWIFNNHQWINYGPSPAA